jgi:hypothetical protein
LFENNCDGIIFVGLFMSSNYLFTLYNFRYHHFHIRPPVGSACLKLKREMNNRYDANAVTVKLEDGRTIGRVPREVAAVIAPALATGVIMNMTGIHTGEMTHDGPRVSGGPKLNVLYLFEIRDNANDRYEIHENFLKAGISESDVFADLH